jgi:hypothetical protein
LGFAGSENDTPPFQNRINQKKNGNAMTLGAALAENQEGKQNHQNSTRCQQT